MMTASDGRQQLVVVVAKTVFLVLATLASASCASSVHREPGTVLAFGTSPRPGDPQPLLVVTIASADGSHHVGVEDTDRRLRVDGMTLEMVLATLYRVPSASIVGLAKHRDDRVMIDVVGGGSKELRVPLVQAALALALGYRAQTREREESVYALTQCSGEPPRMPVSTRTSAQIYPGVAEWNGDGVSMATVARVLSERYGVVVVDETHLADKYNIVLALPPVDNACVWSQLKGIAADMGLCVESCKRPLPVLEVEWASQQSRDTKQ